MLLDVGCQVNTLDGSGKSPLMHAVVMNDPELVQFLIQVRTTQDYFTQTYRKKPIVMWRTKVERRLFC